MSEIEELVGQVWEYRDGLHNNLYLVLGIDPYEQVFATLLGLESGNVHEGYPISRFHDKYLPWVRHT